MVYQVDLEKQAIDPFDPGHNYAWTNTYLIGVVADEDAQRMMLALADIESGVLPIDTSIRFGCWRPRIGGPVPGDVQTLGISGQMPAPAAYQPFANTARVLGYSGRKLVWYKRWRGPLRDVDMSGTMLSSDYYNLLQTSYIDRLRHEIPLVTRSGQLIESWRVDPRVTLWQRRDGSRRNVQSVLAG
jgi:hypothetical protein